MFEPLGNNSKAMVTFLKSVNKTLCYSVIHHLLLVFTFHFPYYYYYVFSISLMQYFNYHLDWTSPCYKMLWHMTIITWQVGVPVVHPNGKRQGDHLPAILLKWTTIVFLKGFEEVVVKCSCLLCFVMLSND